MPSDSKRSVRLLLDQDLEYRVRQLALKEGRPMATMCHRLVVEAEAQRRSSVAEVARLVCAIRATET